MRRNASAFAGIICGMFLACGWSVDALAYRIVGVDVTGDHSAEIVFRTDPAGEGAATYQIKDGAIEVAFPGAELAENLQGKLELPSPHALVQRVSLYSTSKGVTKAKVVLNGSDEKLKERLTLVREAQGPHLHVEYPRGENPSLTLLKEEQQPLAPSLFDKKAQESRGSGVQIFLILFIFALAGVASYFGLRFLKTKGQARGARKYLIEQLGYYPVGPKSGVSLLKVGKEFVLVGITPHQITTLSSLPKLQAQYEEESAFESGTFREAVQEEYQHLRTPQ